MFEEEKFSINVPAHIVSKIKRKAPFFQTACRFCGHINQVPFLYMLPPAIYKRYRGNIFQYGKQLHKDFLVYWDLIHKTQYGELVETGKTEEQQFASLPDFYCPTLHLHLEIKTKVSIDYHWIIKLAKSYGEKPKAWIYFASIHNKIKQAEANPDDLYITVIYFADMGYYAVEVLKLKGLLPTEAPITSQGSGGNMLEVPLAWLQPLNDFLEARKESLNI